MAQTVGSTTMQHVLGEPVVPQTVLTRQFLDLLFAQLERLKPHFPPETSPQAGDQLMEQLREEAAKRQADGALTAEAAKRTKLNQ